MRVRDVCVWRDGWVVCCWVGGQSEQFLPDRSRAGDKSRASGKTPMTEDTFFVYFRLDDRGHCR